MPHSHSATQVDRDFLERRAVRNAVRPEATVFVLDPGCTVPFGHHRAINQLIFDHQQAVGRVVEVYTGHTDDPLLAAFVPRPVFSHLVYEGIPDDPAKTQEQAREFNERFFRELVQHLPALKAGDAIVVHTASVFMLDGLCDWLSCFPTCPISVSIVMMLSPYFTPGIQDISPENRRLIDAIYEHSFSRLRSLPCGVTIFAETTEMAAVYERIAGGPIAVCPLPIDFHHWQATRVADTDKRQDPVFLFAGNCRPEKGILLIPDAVEKYVTSGGRGRFRIQCGQPPGEKDAKANAINALRQMERVELIEATLTGADYWGLLDAADVLLAPYDPTMYGTIRPSRIFLESLGIGKPVIVSPGTWMEETLNELSHKCGITMATYDSESLCRAMLACESELDELTTNAAIIAPQIRQVHNNGTYMKCMLQLVKDCCR